MKSLVLSVALAILSLFGTAAAGLPSRAAEEIDSCEYSVIASARPGYRCQAEGVLWEVLEETYSGQPVYLDHGSGIKVTSVLTRDGEHFEAPSRCSGEYRLPSGYPSIWNGMYGYPDQPSDFQKLLEDGLSHLLNAEVGYLWSDTLFFYDERFAFIFNVNFVEINQAPRLREEGVGTVCVASSYRIL